ncbi:hypothetical protein IGI43_003305 [Enterococcus sp. AZ126]
MLHPSEMGTAPEGVNTMTSKNRKSITFTDQMEEDLAFLLDKKRKERKKAGNNRQYHEKDMLAEVLHQAREVKEAFG